MRRFVAILASALVGCTVGYLSHQVIARRARRQDELRESELTVAAPITSLFAATAVGFVLGPRMAFATGLVVSAIVGWRLEEAVPALWMDVTSHDEDFEHGAAAEAKASRETDDSGGRNTA